MICYMRCVNAFFIDITNIFVNMTDFSCHFNQKDTLRIPNECLCVILTYYFLLCMSVTKATENKPQSLDPDCFLTLANPTVKVDLVLCTNSARRSLV